MLYHTSNPRYRELIAKEGLIPKQETWGNAIGSDYNIELGDTKAIFVNEDEPYDSTYDDDIYEIDVNKIDNVFHKDLHTTNGKYTLECIPLEAITLIYQGTGK